MSKGAGGGPEGWQAAVEQAVGRRVGGGGGRASGRPTSCGRAGERRAMGWQAGGRAASGYPNRSYIWHGGVILAKRGMSCLTSLRRAAELHNKLWRYGLAEDLLRGILSLLGAEAGPT